MNRAQLYGFEAEAYFKSWNESSLMIGQIENIKGIDSLEKILKTKILDGIMIGPYDLSASIGTPGKFNSIEFESMIEKYKKISNDHDKIMGLHVVEPSKKLLKERKR